MRKEMMSMARFIPKEKLSKKAQKELNRQRRVTWDFSPVTKTVDSRKIYSRKRKAQDRDDYGLSFFDACFSFYFTPFCLDARRFSSSRETISTIGKTLPASMPL